MKNIIFIGGVHGSGKGTICKSIKGKTEFIHLTASEVLKWEELNSQEEKKVANINQMQDRLVYNLNKVVKFNKKYLLDGHYSLLNKDGAPEKIPLQTFKDIDPIKLILVTAEPKVIKERLESRDSKYYDIKLIEDFQNLEFKYANQLSQILESPILIINSEKFKTDNLLNFLQ